MALLQQQHAAHNLRGRHSLSARDRLVLACLLCRLVHVCRDEGVRACIARLNLGSTARARYGRKVCVCVLCVCVCVYA